MTTPDPISTPPEPDFHRHVDQSDEELLGHAYTPPEPPPPLVWPFIKACITAMAMSIGFTGLFYGGGFGLGDFKIMHYIASALALQMLVPLVLPPAWVLAKLAVHFRVPRGFADIAIGGLLGCVMLISGDWKLQHVAFIMGGLVGGFVFWRAQGYPGASERTAKLGDAAARVIR
ncbi:MAG: hypothetical protein HKM95_11060 [Inquilinus sp.]|nr:hypothetical protein [Inquilinus sp.]